MSFTFVTNLDVIANVLQFFGGVNVTLSFWRPLASALDEHLADAVAKAAAELIANATSHRDETVVVSSDNQSVKICSRQEVVVILRTLTDQEREAHPSVTSCYHVTVELTGRGKRLALAFVAFVFDMKEFWWLPISMDGKPPVLAAMLHQTLGAERVSELISRLAPARQMHQA